MTENQEKITPEQIAKKQEETKVKYEADIAEAQQTILSLKNTIADKDDEIFELQKSNKKLSEERDDWKTEAHSARRVQQETKEFKEQTNVLTELAKLQAKKGIDLEIQNNN